MKRLLLLTSALLLLAVPAAHAEHPAPTGFVVDAAEVIEAPVQATIEAELRDYSRRTTNQVAVVLVQSLEGETVEDYTRSLFNEWGVGTKAKNNGVLLLVSLDDREDRIQVGFGLEKLLTDEVAQGVLDDVVTPAAAEGDWAAAALRGERALRKALHDPRASVPAPANAPAATSPFGGGEAAPSDDVTDGTDVVPDGAIDVTGNNPGFDAPAGSFEDQGDHGFPFGILLVPLVAVVAVGMFRAVGRGGGRGSQSGRRGISAGGVAAGSLLYQQQQAEASRASSLGGFDSGPSSSPGAGSSGGSDFGGGSSGDGGASGSW